MIFFNLYCCVAKFERTKINRERKNKVMNTEDLNDELEPEDDLQSLTVGESEMLLNQIQLDVDIAKIFPDSKSVNEALRFLIRITKRHINELTNK